MAIQSWSSLGENRPGKAAEMASCFNATGQANHPRNSCCFNTVSTYFNDNMVSMIPNYIQSCFVSYSLGYA
jgi:hypothetical protein